MILLPSLLATQAGGQGRFQVEAATVEEALRALPIADLLFDEHGGLRPLVNVFVEGNDIRALDGLATQLDGDTAVRVVAAIAGG